MEHLVGTFLRATPSAAAAVNYAGIQTGLTGLEYEWELVEDAQCDAPLASALGRGKGQGVKAVRSVQVKAGKTTQACKIRAPSGKQLTTGSQWKQRRGRQQKAVAPRKSKKCL